MAHDPNSFDVRGIEPKDVRFTRAPREVHRAFWRYVTEVALEVKDRSLAAGLDKDGKPLHPIAASTRAKGFNRSYTRLGDPDAPPLTPAYGLSRTRALLRGRAYDDQAELYWAFDRFTRRPWGEILAYHRQGGPILRHGVIVGTLPVRDVIGFSARDLAGIARRGQEWWHHFQTGEILAYQVKRRGREMPKTGAIPPPPKFPLEGRTDIEHYTVGIGAEMERTKRAIAEGYHSGFTRRTPGMPTITRGNKPPPLPKPKPAAAQPAVIDLATFAAQAKAAARTLGKEGRFGENKVFISHAYRAYAARYGAMTLEEFKRRLGLARQSRLIDLSRADLVEAMDALDVKMSTTFHPSGGGDFQFIRID
jgi:hypothetical protein